MATDLNIIRTYRTSNGRRGAVYTLDGERCASFVPTRGNVLELLAASLGVELAEEGELWGQRNANPSVTYPRNGGICQIDTDSFGRVEQAVAVDPRGAIVWQDVSGGVITADGVYRLHSATSSRRSWWFVAEGGEGEDVNQLPSVAHLPRLERGGTVLVTSDMPARYGSHLLGREGQRVPANLVYG